MHSTPIATGTKPSTIVLSRQAMPHHPTDKATETDVSSSNRRLLGREGDTDIDRSLALANALVHDHLAIPGLSMPTIHPQTYTLPIPFPRTLRFDATTTFTEAQQFPAHSRTAVHPQSSFLRGVDQRRRLLVTTTTYEEEEGSADGGEDIELDWRSYLLSVLHEASRVLNEEDDEDCTY